MDDDDVRNLPRLLRKLLIKLKHNISYLVHKLKIGELLSFICLVRKIQSNISVCLLHKLNIQKFFVQTHLQIDDVTIHHKVSFRSKFKLLIFKLLSFHPFQTDFIRTCTNKLRQIPVRGKCGSLLENFLS